MLIGGLNGVDEPLYFTPQPKLSGCLNRRVYLHRVARVKHEDFVGFGEGRKTYPVEKRLV